MTQDWASSLPTWPPALTEDDERQHPEWPPVKPDAWQAFACDSVREQYNRTRCLNAGCARCWGGPE